VEVTSFELRGNSSDANVQGTLRLSANGGLDGTLELSGAQYDRLFAALTGKPLETATRHLTEGETTKDSPSTKARKLPALRFEDGAAYFGSTLLGHLPALF
jgi:Uncharacterized protein conserved in bacteria (DUF2125)